MRKQLVLMDPTIVPVLCALKSSVPLNSVRENKYLGVFQIVNKYDTSHSAYNSSDFSYVEENMHKNRRGHQAATNREEWERNKRGHQAATNREEWERNKRGHQAATNREEWERERNICRLVIVESGLRLRRLRNGNVKENG